jgi:hypothetical protein
MLHVGDVHDLPPFEPLLEQLAMRASMSAMISAALGLPANCARMLER